VVITEDMLVIKRPGTGIESKQCRNHPKRKELAKILP